MLSGVTSESASMLAELFRTLDKDGSSGVSAIELTEATGGTTGSSASMEEIFAALDADADGVISQTEFVSAFEQFDTEAMSVVLAAQESDTTLTDRLMGALDTDEDGCVSEEEFTAYVEEQTAGSAGASGVAAESLFAGLDVNDDGAVDSAELTAYLANAMAVMPEAGPKPGNGPEMAGSAPPPPPPPGGGESETYDPLDTNKDGVVSAEERAAAAIDIMA